MLRGWYERHAAFYRIESLNVRGSQVETLDAVNLINDQTYRVRVELKRKTCVFQAGQMVYGSLVPWHDEWYWSGTQKTWENPPRDFSSVKREFREKSSFIAYRYCPDLAQRAREFAAEHFADFVRFHGSDLALFPDGLSAAAAEQKRLRVFSEIKAGEDLEKILTKHGVKRPGQGDYPRKFVENEKGVAVFYHEGEGVEMFTGYGILLSGLKKQDEPLTPDEMEILQAFVEEDAISPAFVRRVIRDVGSSGLEKLYFLTSGADGVEYLLRRFKGCYYRKRHSQYLSPRMNKKRPRRDDDREERITMEIIVDAYNESEVWTGWYCYLENTLAFPFEAECVKSRKMSPLKPGERVTVLGMLDDDEGDGLGEMMVEAKWRDCTMGIPLAQIKGIGVDEKTAEAIADWHYWVAQGRQF